MVRRGLARVINSSRTKANTMSEPEKIIMKTRVVYREAEQPPGSTARGAGQLSDAEKFRLLQAQRLLDESGL
jgi:hypothetical protein